MFRDGVGDGQMFTVVEFEVPQMKKCFQMFGQLTQLPPPLLCVHVTCSSFSSSAGGKLYWNLLNTRAYKK